MLFKDLLEIISSLSFLITFHVKPQAVACTHAALTLQRDVHLKEKGPPQRDFSALMTLCEGRGQLEKG